MVVRRTHLVRSFLHSQPDFQHHQGSRSKNAVQHLECAFSENDWKGMYLSLLKFIPSNCMMYGTAPQVVPGDAPGEKHQIDWKIQLWNWINILVWWFFIRKGIVNLVEVYMQNNDLQFLKEFRKNDEALKNTIEMLIMWVVELHVKSIRLQCTLVADKILFFLLVSLGLTFQVNIPSSTSSVSISDFHHLPFIAFQLLFWNNAWGYGHRGESGRKMEKQWCTIDNRQ